MSELRIASITVSAGEAVETLKRYGEQFALTVRLYDNGGRNPADEVTLEDIGRLTASTRSEGKDVKAVMTSVTRKEWHLLLPTADFVHLPENGPRVVGAATRRWTTTSQSTFLRSAEP